MFVLNDTFTISAPISNGEGNENNRVSITYFKVT